MSSWNRVSRLHRGCRDVNRSNEEGVEEAWLLEDLQGQKALLEPIRAGNGGDRRFVVISLVCWREVGHLESPFETERERFASFNKATINACESPRRKRPKYLHSPPFAIHIRQPSPYKPDKILHTISPVQPPP